PRGIGQLSGGRNRKVGKDYRRDRVDGGVSLKGKPQSSRPNERSVELSSFFPDHSPSSEQGINMSVKIFESAEVQDFLKLACGLNNEEGNPRTKEIVHRIVSDIFKAIEDLNITSDEYWAGVAYLNR